MGRLSALALGLLVLCGLLVLPASAQAVGCATGLYMIVARGTTEAVGTGLIGVVAANVSALVPGSVIVPVTYPATFAQYNVSENIGVVATTSLVASYTALCPDSKIALIGYSQGGQVVMDTICGTSETGWNVTSGLSAANAQNVVAVVTFGDPSHLANATWNAGTSKHDGLFPRKNITQCTTYASKIRGWCDTGDIFCDDGSISGVHGSYFGNYTTDAANFIIGKFNQSKAATPSATVSTTSKSTPSPTASASNGASPSPSGNSADAKAHHPTLILFMLGLVAAANL